MSKKKPAPGVTSTESGGMEKAACAGASCSFMQSTTQQGAISSLLLQGRENAITGREIKRILSLKNGWDITSLVERERRQGIPICATCDSSKPGYFLPKTPLELATYNRSLRRRIKNVTVTLNAMEAALDGWTGQMRLDLPGGDGD